MDREFHHGIRGNFNSSRVTEQNLSDLYLLKVLNHTFWRQRQVNPDKTKIAGEEAKKGFRELKVLNTERRQRFVLVWREEAWRERERNV